MTFVSSQVSEERLWQKSTEGAGNATSGRGLMAKKAKQRELALERTLLAQAKRREEETKQITKGHGPPSHSAKRAERRTASGKFQVAKSVCKAVDKAGPE